jgi:hypothetical protein
VSAPRYPGVPMECTPLERPPRAGEWTFVSGEPAYVHRLHPDGTATVATEYSVYRVPLAALCAWAGGAA